MLYGILPNIAAPVIVQTTLAFSGAILAEASLAHLVVCPAAQARSNADELRNTRRISASAERWGFHPPHSHD